MNHLVNVKMTSDRSANSNESAESGKDSKVRGLDVKRSEFAVEDEGNMKESHVETYNAKENRGNVKERTLTRSKQEGLLS